MYHGCDFRNRNGTRKLIDYARGQWCPLETDEYCWKTTKSKFLFKKNIILEKEEGNYFRCSVYVIAVEILLLNV